MNALKYFPVYALIECGTCVKEYVEHVELAATQYLLFQEHQILLQRMP